MVHTVMARPVFSLSQTSHLAITATSEARQLLGCSTATPLMHPRCAKQWQLCRAQGLFHRSNAFAEGRDRGLHLLALEAEHMPLPLVYISCAEAIHHYTCFRSWEVHINKPQSV